MEPKYALICNAAAHNRTITFVVREGFGDGTDGNGVAIAEEGWERKQALRIFEEALDLILAQPSGSTWVERWMNHWPWNSPNCETH